MIDFTRRLAAVLDRLPVAVGLISPTGRLLGKAGGMSNLLGDIIPSHDARAAGHWTMTDASGAIVPSSEWPSARALRGERTCTAMLGSYHDDDGKRPVKVISVPTFDPTSDVAAITFLQVFGAPCHSIDGSHLDLQQRLIDDLVQAVVKGWNRPAPLERVSALETTTPR